MARSTFLLIDDHALFRSGLRLVLTESIPDVEVFEATTLEQAIRVCSEPPMLVLLDIQLGGVNGLEGVRLLREHWPQTSIVMLSSMATPEVVALALARGAVGFVHKGDTSSRLMEVIQRALTQRGRAGVDPSSDQLQMQPERPRLTPRQCEVLDLLCEGLSNKMIARRLQLSEFTVRGHVQAILAVLGATSRSQAIFAARQSGLVG